MLLIFISSFPFYKRLIDFTIPQTIDQFYYLFIIQVDLVHMNSEPNNVSAPVVYGMDLSEYYLNVEWDILRVPAERRVKKYPCCPEPYPGKIFYVT